MSELDQVHLWAPITYVSKGADPNVDSRIVYGLLSNPKPDIDKQKVDPTWFKAAVARWWETGPNIRAMHRNEAVGNGMELVQDGDNWYLTSEIIDRDAIVKIDKGVYRGYSIGTRWPKLRFNDPEAPMGVICGGEMVEASLADRASNYDAQGSLMVAKSALADVAADTEEEAATVEAERILKGAQPPAPPADANKAAEPDSAKGTPAAKAGAPQSPKGYPPAAALYTDPTNHRYPLDSASGIARAIAYYNKNDRANKTAGDYDPAEWNTMGGRIVAAANKRFDGGYSLGADGRIDTPNSPAAANKDAGEETSQSEMTDAQLAAQAAGIIKTLIAREAAEAAGDEDDDDINDVFTLTSALDTLRYFMTGELNETAMLLQAGKFAIGDLFKAGARNSAADTQRIQAIHDHTGNLGAGASDECKANAGKGDDDMNEKAVQAEVTRLLSEQLPAAVQDALTAAGISTEALKSAEAHRTAEVAEIVKGAVTPLEDRLRQVEERAEEGGPLLMTLQNRMTGARVSSEKTALASRVNEAWQRSQTHTDPRARAEAVLEYAAAKSALMRLEAQEN